MVHRAALPSLALALAASSSTGCRGSARLEDIEFTRAEALPGFDIRWPPGKPMRSNTTPAAGEILVRKGTAVLAASWQTGRVTREDLPTFGTATMSAIGTKIGAGDVGQTELTLPAPDYGLRIDSPTNKGAYMVMSMIQCVKANVTVSVLTMAGGTRDAALAFHERFRTTMTCKQDGVPMTTADGLPAFALDNNLAYLPGSDPPSYYSLTGERWHVTPGTMAQRRAFSEPDAIKKLFGSLGLVVTEQGRLPYSGAADWLALRLTVDVEGRTGYVLVGSLGCPAEASYTVVYMNPHALDTPVEASMLDRVSCPTTPVDAATLPTVAERFTAACEGGHGQACVVLADLAEEEQALLPGLDPAALRARACTLGVTDACT